MLNNLDSTNYFLQQKFIYINMITLNNSKIIKIISRKLESIL